MPVCHGAALSELSKLHAKKVRIEPGIATNQALTRSRRERPNPNVPNTCPTLFKPKPPRSHIPIVSVRQFWAKFKPCLPLLNSIHRPHYPPLLILLLPKPLKITANTKLDCLCPASQLEAVLGPIAGAHQCTIVSSMFFCLTFHKPERQMHTILLGALVRPEHLQLPNNMAH